MCKELNDAFSSQLVWSDWENHGYHKAVFIFSSSESPKREAGMLTAKPQYCVQSAWIMTVYFVGQQKLRSVMLLWTRCGLDTTSSCLFVLINSSASLHHLIERYIDSCVASNIERWYVRNQLQFVICLAAWTQELFSNHVIVMADNDVVNMLHFESEIIPSVSAIVTCLGALASLWRAH